MKPSTFITYLGNRLDLLLMGWRSGASFEVHVQVIFDDVVRTHLVNKLQKYTILGEEMKGQALSNMKGEEVDIDSFPKMREERYTSSKKISDMHLDNERWVQYDDKHGDSALLQKNTTYWIELKVESPATHNYGGENSLNAYNADVMKLVSQKSRDKTSPIPIGSDILRRRYWFVMMAFSPDERSNLKHNFKWSCCHDFQSKSGNCFIGLLEV